MSKVHDFSERLKWSEKQSDEPFWNAIYREFFPGMVGQLLASGNHAAQRMGVDRLVYLSNDRCVRIDEKKRDRVWNDILLECKHTSEENVYSEEIAPGWIRKDLKVDFIAYAFMPNKTVYFLDWLILQRAWLHNYPKWYRQYKTVKARNATYWTHSIAVPIPVLHTAMQQASSISLGLAKVIVA